jgi:hypothetical protein
VTGLTGTVTESGRTERPQIDATPSADAKHSARPHSLAGVNYPNVKQAHIVPRTYLEDFASDRKIGVHQVVEGTDFLLPIANVGIRRRAYRRQRPDGTFIDDIEWMLGQGEGVATPVLREFANRWPRDTREKRILAELFAHQLLRGTRWKDEYADANPDILDSYRQEGTITIGDREYAVTEEALARVAQVVSTDSYRLLHMVAVAPTLTSILVSMHWTLVEFAAPVIATSDHPVVLWPGAEARRPQPSRLRSGVLECIEIWLPLSPNHVALMTWSDKPDADDPRAHGNRDHARRFNAFTIANAERQWFHLPGAAPPTATGTLLPCRLSWFAATTHRWPQCLLAESWSLRKQTQSAAETSSPHHQRRFMASQMCSLSAWLRRNAVHGFGVRNRRQ